MRIACGARRAASPEPTGARRPAPLAIMSAIAKRCNCGVALGAGACISALVTVVVAVALLISLLATDPNERHPMGERLARADALAMIVIGSSSFLCCVVLSCVVTVRNARADVAKPPTGRRAKERRNSTEQERAAVTAVGVEIV